MGVLTSYGADNLVIERDYQCKFNDIEVGEPEVTVSLSAGQRVVDISQWYRGQQEETAAFRYVGMDYATAQGCANDLRTNLTFTQTEWHYGTYLSGGQLLYGYYADRTVPVLDSDVTVVKNGNGAMYDVVVDAHVKTTTYSRAADMNVHSQTPLLDHLNTRSGFSDYHSGWTDGQSINSVTASCLTIVQAPSRTRSWEIAGQDIWPEGSGALSNVSFPIWYRCTDDYRCIVKYEGLTLSACRSFYNSLNTTTGWYLSSHPYKYDYSVPTKTFRWIQDDQHTKWQCLNEFRATKGRGNMWTVELQLHAQVEQYNRNPSYVNNWSWPNVWRNNIPGLSAYL